MLIHLHIGQPVAPHDVAGAWNLDPLILGGCVAVLLLYRRGNRQVARHRRLAFHLGLTAVVVALISPLDAVSRSLASAHMVQHLLLLVVAAPALAWGRPLATILHGATLEQRKGLGRWRSTHGLTPRRLRWLRSPIVAWAALTGVTWVWHAGSLYDAAVANELVHAVEHASFLFAATWFWGVVTEATWQARSSMGVGVLGLFGMALQGVFLAVLMTFAPTPWYDSYQASAVLWGMTPLQDQQLAGVLMWVPTGLVYTAAGLMLVSRWVATSGVRPFSRV